MRNSELQILRWGIPGWLTILTYFILELSIKEYKISELFMNVELDGGILAGIGAILTAIGIPLGYVVYQIYFWVKWRLLKDDQKIKDLMEIIPLFKELERDSSERVSDHLDNWKRMERTFDIYLSYYIMHTKLKYEDMLRQNSSLKSRIDRVHGLGASIAGILIATLIFIFFNFGTNGLDVFRSSYFLLTLSGLILVIIIFVNNYFHANKNSYEQMRSIIVDIEVAKQIEK